MVEEILPKIDESAPGALIVQPLKSVMLSNSGVMFLHGAIVFIPTRNCFVASTFSKVLSLGFSDFTDGAWI
jgi:hypothetical protein